MSLEDLWTELNTCGDDPVVVWRVDNQGSHIGLGLEVRFSRLLINRVLRRALHYLCEDEVRTIYELWLITAPVDKFDPEADYSWSEVLR